MIHKEQIRSAYDQVAGDYAAKFWNEVEHKHFDRIMLEWYATQIPRDESVLEIGAGPGEISGHLSKLGVHCVATDISPRMVEQGRRLFPNVRFEVEDYFDLSFAERTFAAVVAYYAIVNYPLQQLAPILREVLRVLKPNGLFLFTFHVFEGEESTTVRRFLDQEIEELTFYYFGIDALKALVTELGFQVVDIVVRQPYPGVEFESQRAYFLLRKS